MEEFSYTVSEHKERNPAEARITAVFVMEAMPEFGYKYIIFFHGSGNVYTESHGNAALAVAAYTNDFKNFFYEL